MKHVKDYQTFINEGALPFSVEKELRLGGVSFIEDDERTEEALRDHDQAKVYVAVDKGSGSEWEVTAALDGGFYRLFVKKDDKEIWSNKYPKNMVASYQQDCMNTLGLVPELDT